MVREGGSSGLRNLPMQEMLFSGKFKNIWDVHDKYSRKLLLFSVCNMATQLIDQEITQTNIYANILLECRELAKKFEEFKIIHYI